MKKTALVAATLAFGLGTGTAYADPLPTIVIETEIVEMNLSGGGSVPLGFDDTMPSPTDGYGFVQSDVAINESAALGSSLTTTLAIAGDVLSIGLDFELALDFHFTDVDAGADYTDPIGSSLSLVASDPDKHVMRFSQAVDVSYGDVQKILGNILVGLVLGEEGLTLETVDDLAQQFLNDLVAMVPELGVFDVDPAVFAIEVDGPGGPEAVDVNKNGPADEMEISPDGITFSPEDIMVTVPGVETGIIGLIALADDELGPLLDQVVELIESGLAGPSAVADELVAGIALSIDALNVSLTGDVRDAISDPPFTLDLTGSARGLPPGSPPASTVPAPATALLILAALPLLRRSRRG